MICYNDGEMTANMNYSTRKFLFSKHLKQITAGVLLLFSSMVRSPEVECAVLYPRQPESKHKPYLSSEAIRGYELFYPKESNARPYKLFNINQETGQRFPDNSVYINDVDSG